MQKQAIIQESAGLSILWVQECLTCYKSSIYDLIELKIHFHLLIFSHYHEIKVLLSECADGRLPSKEEVSNKKSLNANFKNNEEWTYLNISHHNLLLFISLKMYYA